LSESNQGPRMSREDWQSDAHWSQENLLIENIYINVVSVVSLKIIQIESEFNAIYGIDAVNVR